MSPTTTTIDSVQAEDAVRQAISAVSGRDQATVKYTPTSDGNLVPSDQLVPHDGLVPSGVALTVIGVRIEEGGGTAVGTGTLMARRGLLCSDSIELCSDNDANMVCSDWTSPSGTQLTDILTYAETGAPADGPETIYVWVATDGQGYS